VNRLRQDDPLKVREEGLNQLALILTEYRLKSRKGQSMKYSELPINPKL
jgi:hypothetical protein